MGFRELYELIHDHNGESVYEQVIAPWIESNLDHREWLDSFALCRGDPIPPADDDDLWTLYALSRINETLLLRFQQGQADGSAWPGPEISSAEYLHFAESLSLKAAEVDRFSPFYHEIVEVEEAQDHEEPLHVTSTIWPCLMLGDMLFSRAGVRVLGGRRFIRKEVAEASPLYWAFRRKNRPYEDLSHGWGSNSQWRTRFRRDYRLGTYLFYNVDGEHDLRGPGVFGEERDGLTIEERIELLTYRCFVRTIKPSNDLFPYRDKFHEEASNFQ